LLDCCWAVVTLLLHCCYTVVTLLLHYCYTFVAPAACEAVYVCALISVVDFCRGSATVRFTIQHRSGRGELSLHSCYTVVALLLHCCYTVVTLSLHCRYTVVTLLLRCCCAVVTMLSHCLGRGDFVVCTRLLRPTRGGEGVTVVSQWCYSGVTVVLQWYYSGVTVVLLCLCMGSIRGGVSGVNDMMIMILRAMTVMVCAFIIHPEVCMRTLRSHAMLTHQCVILVD
jgi:hypothetical protein